jgi:hypothetical protein
MENIDYDFAESIADGMYEIQQSNFDMLAINSPGPEDEDENDDDDKDDDKGKGSNDDNDPPLDEEVVHSPVTTQDGGRPK